MLFLLPGLLCLASCVVSTLLCDVCAAKVMLTRLHDWNVLVTRLDVIPRNPVYVDKM